MKAQNIQVKKSCEMHIFCCVWTIWFASMKSLFDICVSYSISIQSLKPFVSFVVLQSILFSSFPSKQIFRKILYLQCISWFLIILNFSEPRLCKSTTEARAYLILNLHIHSCHKHENLRPYICNDLCRRLHIH